MISYKEHGSIVREPLTGLQSSEKQRASPGSCKDQVAVVAGKGPVSGKEGTPCLKAMLIKSYASNKGES